MKNKKLWVSLLAGFMALVMLLSLVVSLIPTRARAASSNEIQSQIDYENSPEGIAEKTLENAKIDRAEAVSRITVEVDGMEFDGDETAQDRMARAITMFNANNLPADTVTPWVLADNTVAEVTVAQLSKALLLAGQAQTALWAVPYQNEETNAGNE